MYRVRHKGPGPKDFKVHAYRETVHFKDGIATIKYRETLGYILKFSGMEEIRTDSNAEGTEKQPSGG
jgi:hypothetical protein